MAGKKVFSLLNALAVVLNVLAALLLLSAYMADFISPASSVFFAFAGLAYPFLLLLNLFFAVYWLVQRRRMALLSLLCIGVGIHYLLRYYQYGGNLEPVPEDRPVTKVMSYNVQLFGRYQTNAKEGGNVSAASRDTMLDVMERVKPDILCMQEFCHLATAFPTIPLLHQKLPHLRYAYPALAERTSLSGVNVILSAYPVLQGGVVSDASPLWNGYSAVYADLKVGKDTLRVYSLHLQSVQLQKDDYDFAQRWTTANGETEGEEFSVGSRRMFGKLRAAYGIRCLQVDSIVAHVARSPYPVVVCGDFNDTPWSYTYRQFGKCLKDAQVHSGKGRGNTFVLNRLLRFRIDYVFYSASLDNWGHSVLRKQASDHFPVYTYIAF
ncbi:MAG: endonuclease/exonuclease/phosphatase family protein [Bacteroidales bacterium]|nr:endonuclease/exonuclease/phosphatase family protein [Bacteroidales bacterium]